MPLRALTDIHIDWVIEYTVSKILFDVFCDNLRARLQYEHSYIVLKSDFRADHIGISLISSKSVDSRTSPAGCRVTSVYL